MLWLVGLSVMSCLLVLFLLGRREERAVLRNLERLLARRKASGEATDSSSPGGLAGENLTFRTAMLWMSLLAVIFVALHFSQNQKTHTSKRFTEFMAMVDAGEVADVTITGNEIKGHTVAHEAFRSFAPPVGYDKLVDGLLAHKVMVTCKPDEVLAWASLLFPWTPFLLLAALGIPFAWQARTAPVVRERWRLKREGYTALLKGLTELRNHLAELVGPGEARADRVDTLVGQLATERGVAELWLRIDIIVLLTTVDHEVRVLGRGKVPQPGACRHAIQTIDQALELLAEAFRRDFRLERRGV